MPKKKNKKINGYSNSFILKIIITVMVALMLLGVVFWQVLESTDGNRPQHKMAEGVAKFYASFRKSFMPGEQQLNDHTILLPEETQSLRQRLHERAAKVEPDSPNWKGTAKRRAFKENDTIRNALATYAQEEGVELIWDLKYDYIIKYHFEERTSFTNLVERVSKTVNNDFDGKVKSYFCPQERAMVVTADDNQYVQEFCVITTSKRRLEYDKKREKEYKMRKELGIN